MNSLAPNTVEQSVLNGAPVDAQLYTAGGHVALIVNGIALGGEDIPIPAVDGQLSAAQIIGDILQPLHGSLLPCGLQRLQNVALLCAAVDLQHLHRDVRIGQHAGVDIPKFLDGIHHEMVEIRLCRLAVGLHRLELCHGAADGNSGAGRVGQTAGTRVKEHLHGLVLLRRTHGIGCRDLAVLVGSRVLFRPRPDAPLLAGAAVAGRQRVFQPEAMLVQRRLRPVPTGDGQRTVQIGDARAAVHHADLHRIAQILEGHHNRHGEVGVVAVGTEIGNRIVCQLADSLRRAVEIVTDTREKSIPGGIVMDNLFRNGVVVPVFHG